MNIVAFGRFPEFLTLKRVINDAVQRDQGFDASDIPAVYQFELFSKGKKIDVAVGPYFMQHQNKTIALTDIEYSELSQVIDRRLGR